MAPLKRFWNAGRQEGSLSKRLIYPKGLWCTLGFKLPGLFYLFVCFFGQLIVHGVKEKVTKTKPILVSSVIPGQTSRLSKILPLKVNFKTKIMVLVLEVLEESEGSDANFIFGSVFKASLYLSDYCLKNYFDASVAVLFLSKRSHCFHCCYCYCYFILFLFFECDAEVPNKCLCHPCHFSVWLSSRVVFLWGVITASVRHLLVPGHLGKWWEAICCLRRKRTSLLCLRFGDVGLRWKKTSKKERKKNQGHGQPLAF